MKLLSREELAELIKVNHSPSISIYMPAHRSGDTEQDPIRLKNLLREAESRLCEYGLRPSDARTLLEPANALLKDLSSWQNKGDGLALFLSEGIFKYYTLPRKFQELVVITDRFHIKPLLPLFSEDGAFYVLALSQKQVRLLQCTRYHARTVTPEEVPSGLKEALNYDQMETQLQFRTAEPGGSAIFHGHGPSKEIEKTNILRYFQKVDRGLHEVLREEHSPLIIAAVDFLHPLYREANTYPYLLDQGIVGSPDDLSEKALQEKGWDIAKDYFAKGRDVKTQQFYEAVRRGLASGDIIQVAEAAYDGRVATLFVAEGVQEWGYFDPENRTAAKDHKGKPGAQDLLDFAAVNTLTRGGAVYVQSQGEVPGKTPAPVAAIYRY